MEFKNYGEAIKAVHDCQEPLRKDIRDFILKRIEDFENETGLTVCKASIFLGKSYPDGRYVDVETRVKMDE